MSTSRRLQRKITPAKHKNDFGEGAESVDEPLKKTPRMGRRNNPSKIEKNPERPQYRPGNSFDII